MAAERAVNFDIAKCREDFPLLRMGKLAFLDSAASAQKPDAVIDAMQRVYQSGYANIHRGLYKLSQNLTQGFEAVRAQVAAFIGAPSAKNIVFTRNATEAINLVAQSWGRVHLKQGDEVILSQMEHHANIVPWQLLQAQSGVVLKFIPVLDDGTLDVPSLEKLLSKRTRLLSVAHISNSLGTINDVAALIKLVRTFDPAIKIMVDGSQGVVHSRINVTAIDADFYVFTGHKLYGPTGIGVLYGRYEVLDSMPPYQGGGDMINRVSEEGSSYKEPPYRFEAGTPAIVEVIGLGAALTYVENIGMDCILAHENILHDYAMDIMLNLGGLTFYGVAPHKAGIISFNMEGAHASDVGMVLDQMDIAVRTGHHCCMPLMKRFGVDSTVRVSLALYSNKKDIDQLAEGLHKVKRLFS